MVELSINGNKIELPKKTGIKFTKQISDIFDIASVSVSYSNSFSFDKTPVNTQVMQQAGISGDNSNIPYQKNNAILKYNGFDVVSNGWFNLISTGDNYTGSILDGMVDFFKAIENKTMGLDLDLSNFEHVKNIPNIVNSFSNEYYNYIVADYGGKLIYLDGINVDYLAPCFSVKKMWELIFSTFNFNCDYTNLGYLNGLYITYPKEVVETQTFELIAELKKNAYTTSSKTKESGGFVYLLQKEYEWDEIDVSEGSVSDQFYFKIPETGSYNFDLVLENYMTYKKSGYYDRRLDTTVTILKNGNPIGTLLSDYNEGESVGDERFLSFNIGCDKGDFIYLEVKALNRRDFRGKYFYAYEWHHNKTVLKISKASLGSTTLGAELKDFSIKDFIKEILWRTGLTPVLDKETRTVYFNVLNDRIDFSKAQYLSNTYKKRNSETYQSDYAQKNIFSLKKNNENDKTGDGYLYVQNVNLPDEKIIVQSKIYSPDKNSVTENFFDIKSNLYKIWETEIKENETPGEPAEINYKSLSGRFYFIRKTIEDRGGTGYKLISEILNDEQEVPEINVGINTNTLFDEAVFNNYSEYQKIFNNFRIHNIDMIMTINDFIGLDLTKPVFFRQENAYYICNKITYEDAEVSKGEFIKINKI